jgi:hypothetical protein
MRKLQQASTVYGPNEAHAICDKDSLWVVQFFMWFGDHGDHGSVHNPGNLYAQQASSHYNTQNTTPMQVDRGAPWGRAPDAPTPGSHFPGQLPGLPGQMTQGIGGIQAGQAPVSTIMLVLPPLSNIYCSLFYFSTKMWQMKKNGESIWE